SFDIRLHEVAPLEQEGLASCFRERVSEAIAEIQGCRMAALAKIKECLPSQMSLFHTNGLDRDASAAEEDIALTAGIGTDLTLNYNSELDKVRRADQGPFGVVNQFRVVPGFRLAKKDGGERG